MCTVSKTDVKGIQCIYTASDVTIFHCFSFTDNIFLKEFYKLGAGSFHKLAVVYRRLTVSDLLNQDSENCCCSNSSSE